MSGDVAALASWWHRELGLQCVHDDRFVPSCEKWATQFLRTGIDALAPLIAERVEAAKAEVVAPFRQLAREWNLTKFPDERTAATMRSDLTRLLAALDPEATP